MVTDIRYSVKGTGIFRHHLIRCGGPVDTFCLIPAHDKASLTAAADEVTARVTDHGADISIEVPALICHQDLARIDHLTVILPDFQLCFRLILAVQSDHISVICDPHGHSTFGCLELKIRIDLIQYFDNLAIFVIESHI